jgi:hypothetical protein
MAEGRQRDAWERHSVLLCLLANVNRQAKKRPFKPEHFNPFAKRDKDNDVVITKENIYMLKRELRDLPVVKVGKGKR